MVLAVITVFTKSVSPFYIVEKSVEDSRDNGDDITNALKVLHLWKISPSSNLRRSNIPSRQEKVQTIYNMLKKEVGIPKIKQILRTKEKVRKPGMNPHLRVVEEELKQVVGKKPTGLLSKPYILNSGKHDYLVFLPAEPDVFATVVPNDIYFNTEKPCVNWLQDCDFQGIRARMLQKVLSPYR